jgi:uncharacterized membrane protein
MPNAKKDKIWHNIFIIGIAIKGIDGVLELIGGILLLFVKSDLLANIVRELFRHELAQDPTDLIANYLIHESQYITPNFLSFASLYLIIHGFIKISIAAGLWAKKLWAYNLAGFALALFVLYQTARFINTLSVVLLFLTLIDAIILILLRLEYNRAKKIRNT